MSTPGAAQYVRLFRSVWQITTGLIRRHPKLLLPFATIGVLDALVLTLAYLSPREPFQALLAPPIRAFWGDRFLHYPSNFFVLPKLYEYGHILMLAGAGVIMIGTAVGMLAQANQGRSPQFWANAWRATKRYVTIFWIWLVGFVAVMLLVKGLRLLVFTTYDTTLKASLPPRSVMLEVVLWLSILGALVVEALWVYAMPVAMLEGQRWWRSLAASCRLAGPLFVPTFLLVFVPSTLVFSITILKQQLGPLMRLVAPEVALWVMALGVVYSLIVEWAVTTSATVMYLVQRDSRKP
jgi:hypothetical protein